MKVLEDHKPRRSKLLGELEEEILETLWEGGAQTGRDLYERVRLERPLAYTTVLTVLDRMVRKGLVLKERGERFQFRAAFTREELARRFSRELLPEILGLSASSAIAGFMDVLAEADPSQIDELAKILERKRKQGGGS
jgi:predicted transcriptional regulator